MSLVSMRLWLITDLAANSGVAHGVFLGFTLSQTLIVPQISAGRQYRWTGDYWFLLRQLILKDFKVRYRNMSLGLFWSVLNPLIMMAVWTYVFTKIFQNPVPHYSIHLLSAIIPFNFFTLAWLTSTTSLHDNAGLIKRIPIRREIIPIAAILSNIAHLAIQLILLIVFLLIDGLSANKYWLWLPVVWGLELLFLIGVGLASSALNVLVRDVRYVVESFNLILFWIVPIVYSFAMVPPEMKDLYQYNPIAALILATHTVILDARAPGTPLLIKLATVSITSLLVGSLIFKKVERRFYEYL
jgi:lipopolysaccharide transport system permease protein